MTIENERVRKVVNEFEGLSFFGPLQKFPKEFYKLNEEEQAQTIRLYKERMANRPGRPYRETK